MKRLFILYALIFYSVFMVNAECVVIPAPEYFKEGQGVFTVTGKTAIVCNKSLEETAEIFSKSVSDILVSDIEIISKGKFYGNITLTLKSDIESEEGYSLDINEKYIEITAKDNAGIFNGLQSLRQIIYAASGKNIPAQNITDKPRFGWRGLMLDVSRTFMNVAFVKRYIDLCSMYKLNVIHMHLTDDQGWRVEIKRYPRLTGVGSKFDGEFNRMGGYYTQDDIRELVNYAALRNITIVPEIEMPGHACAVIASYPELSCAKVIPKIHTFLEGASVHNEILCAGNNYTYEFLYGVLDEIMELFPSQYIHIGGDEAPKVEWQKCADCQKAIKDNGLKDEEQLQSLFVKRIGEYLSKHNRTLVGWDEIMDGGMLKGDEVLMYWRGWMDKQVQQQIGKSFKVVCTPTSHCYFDYDYNTIDTKRIYEYEPVHDKSMEANYMGVQANFWSHIDRSESNIDKQLFPRIFGLAETAWSTPENKNWERFKVNAQRNTTQLREQFVNVYEDNSLKD